MKLIYILEEGRSTEAEEAWVAKLRANKERRGRRELKGDTTGHAALRLVIPRNIADQ